MRSSFGKSNMAVTCFTALISLKSLLRLCMRITLVGLFFEPSFRLFHFISNGNIHLPFSSSLTHSEAWSFGMHDLTSKRSSTTLALSINYNLLYLLITLFIRPLVENLKDCILICFHICISFPIVRWTNIGNAIHNFLSQYLV